MADDIVLDGRTCVFCGAAGRMSREDAIAQWIAEVLDDMEMGDVRAEWGFHYESGGVVARERQFPVSRPEVVLRRVCRECNSGWMSRSEVRAKPVLEPMIRGRQTEMDPLQQIDVAGWASKTVTALEFYEPAIVVARPEDRAIIRGQARPPHHHRVRLAFRDAYTEPLVVKEVVARRAERADACPDSFIATLGIGHLIVQVWGGHGAEAGPGLARVGTSNGRAVMIWPPTTPRTVWPPAIAVEDAEFDSFVREVMPWAYDSPDMAAWRSRRTLSAEAPSRGR